MLHKTSEKRLVYFLLISMIVIFHTAAGFAIDKKFNRQQISDPAPKNSKVMSSNDLQQIGERLMARMAVNSSNGVLGSSMSRAMEAQKPHLAALNKMKDTAGLSDLNIHWNEMNPTPTHISVRQAKSSLSKPAVPLAARTAAIEFFKANRELFRLNDPQAELQTIDEVSDALGKTHIKFRQYFNGLPVWGHDIVAHLDEYHQVYAINARYSPTPAPADIDRSDISAQSAIQIAETDLQKTVSIGILPEWAKTACNYEKPGAQKYIWIESNSGKAHLIWHVQIRPNIRDNWYYFVDARNGAILEKYNATNFDGPATAQAVDLNGVTQTVHSYLVGNSYYMIDASRPIWQSNQPNLLNDPLGALWTVDANNHDIDQNLQVFQVTSATNTWSDPVSVSSNSNMGIVFDYFYNTHGRNAIDNKGSTIISMIHVTQNGKGMDNAYWNGAFMLYGDGNVAYKPLAGGLDVAAHEMAHGITQHTVGLEYKFQSGALNESISDVFGAMVDREDWLLGEDVAKTTYYPTGALRDMEDPHNGGANINDLSWQPKTMNEFVELSINDDNGGVHVNSGIPNHACYLIGSAIGKDKTEKIYYRILDARYLNTQSNFIDMRLAAIQAAKDLYGDGSAEMNAVVSAFDAVGIGGGDGSKPDPDVPPVIGTEWIATIGWQDGALYLVKPVIQNPETDIILLTETPVNTETGNPISVSDDGSVIMFVDGDHNLRAINSDGSGEVVVSGEGVWNSIALSPNGMMLAATTTFADSSIYFFDLSGQNIHKKIRLYSPTTQENIRNYTTVLADAMDWNLTGQYLIFDSYTSIPQADGGNLSYWSINILDPANELISLLFPPQPEGISIGNPSFGQTNDIYFVFDYIDLNQGITQVRSANLFTGEVFVVEANGNSIGYPRYSSDDRKLVFERWEVDGQTAYPTLRQVALKESKTEPAGGSTAFVNEGRLPVWFTVGSRPTDVEPTGEKIPAGFYLSQNYPNPFNPSTVIEYHLSMNAKVTLKVYNILGEEVAVLADGVQSAGTHRVEFNAADLSSGIYLYRLNTPDHSEVRRMLLLK